MASKILEYNGTRYKDVYANNMKMNMIEVNGTLQWVREYALTISTIAGVATQKITRVGSTYAGAPTGGTPLTSSDTIYYGDILFFEATAKNGYYSPSFLPEDGYYNVGANVTTSEFIFGGSIIPYTFTKNAITGVGAQSFQRTASSLGGTITTYYDTFTVYYGDVIVVTATKSTGYNDPTIKNSPVSISGNTNSSLYITAGSLSLLTYTRGTLPTGVASITTQVTNSGGTVLRTLSNLTDTFSPGDYLKVTATALTGYNAVPIYTIQNPVTSDFLGNLFVGNPTVISFTVTVSAIAGVNFQSFNRTSSPLQGATTGWIYDKTGTGSFTAYYNDVFTISATALPDYYDPAITGSPKTATAAFSSNAHIFSGGIKPKVMTGFNAHVNEGGRMVDSWSPGFAITVSSAVLKGGRNGASFSVGYIIKNGTTTVKSGTGSSVTLTSTERAKLNANATKTVDCSSPTGTTTYYYTAELTITYVR